jgi:hypothetical protein
VDKGPPDQAAAHIIASREAGDEQEILQRGRKTLASTEYRLRALSISNFFSRESDESASAAE